ncbi:MAG TPA: sulfur carrier protein ThiS [Anaerolineaceae bacterium]|nr:sulfur carrier protein ThiS [Anaerolineaceae bacterium]
MIKVNTEDHPWTKPLSVQELLDEKGYIFPHIVVRINGEYIEEDEYPKRLVQDGDDVLVLHLMAGG